MSTGRFATPGKTRTCPHCRSTILDSATVCPGCNHHLRFDPSGAGQRMVPAATPLRVEGTLRHPSGGEAWEYSVVLAIRNERGQEIARQVVGVGALQPAEARTFTLAVELFKTAELREPKPPASEAPARGAAGVPGLGVPAAAATGAPRPGIGVPAAASAAAPRPGASVTAAAPAATAASPGASAPAAKPPGGMPPGHLRPPVPGGPSPGVFGSRSADPPRPPAASTRPSSEPSSSVKPVPSAKPAPHGGALKDARSAANGPGLQPKRQ